MIVISGALVLVALVLLIIGVVGPELSFVYASIAVSLVSLVFLVVGILQRRGETAAAEGAAPADAAPAAAATDSVTAVIPSQVSRSGARTPTDEPPAAPSVELEPLADGMVLVVEGRPRYHVDGCRYLTGKDAEEVEVAEAREEGFSPCGVCKPDDALAAQQAGRPAEEVVEEDVPGVEVPAPARRTTGKAAAKAPAKAPAKKAATKAVKAPAKAPARAATPTKAAKAAAPATAAGAAAGSRPGSVVVIPDRGKYHRAECRYVRGVDDAEVVAKSSATRQGYAACGVCKP